MRSSILIVVATAFMVALGASIGLGLHYYSVGSSLWIWALGSCVNMAGLGIYAILDLERTTRLVVKIIKPASTLFPLAVLELTQRIERVLGYTPNDGKDVDRKSEENVSISPSSSFGDDREQIQKECLNEKWEMPFDERGEAAMDLGRKDPFYESDEWKKLSKKAKERDGNRCQIAGCPSREELHAHHIIARSKGGPDTLQNLIALCAFHHAIQDGHEGLWEKIGSTYFSFVREHERAQATVQCHLRRREAALSDAVTLRRVMNYYEMRCPHCRAGNIALEGMIRRRNQLVTVQCTHCKPSKTWSFFWGLPEETGPLMAEDFPGNRQKPTDNRVRKHRTRK